MAILIKGMEMPVCCVGCDFHGSIFMPFPEGIYCCDCPAETMRGKDISRAIVEDCRDPNCPLIEIPEHHGDLIDKASLIDEIVKIKDLRTLSTKTIGEAIDRTPTIIPASKEGET